MYSIFELLLTAGRTQLKVFWVYAFISQGCTLVGALLKKSAYEGTSLSLTAQACVMRFSHLTIAAVHHIGIWISRAFGDISCTPVRRGNDGKRVCSCRLDQNGTSHRGWEKLAFVDWFDYTSPHYSVSYEWQKRVVLQTRKIRPYAVVRITMRS